MHALTNTHTHFIPVLFLFCPAHYTQSLGRNKQQLRITIWRCLHICVKHSIAIVRFDDVKCDRPIHFENLTGFTEVCCAFFPSVLCAEMLDERISLSLFLCLNSYRCEQLDPGHVFCWVHSCTQCVCCTFFHHSVTTFTAFASTVD